MKVNFTQAFLDQLAACIGAGVHGGFGHFRSEFTEDGGNVRTAMVIVVGDDEKPKGKPEVQTVTCNKCQTTLVVV